MLLHSAAGFQSALGNLCTPPLHFRRRPPQSNYPPDSVSKLDYSLWLGPQKNQSGISLMTPRQLAPSLQSLPPMLHKSLQKPMPGCSKGARGLFVPPRVHGIFTAPSISLSLSLRQRGSRYAIHAGRNLPDKEFRYLRTVIVTAAVYWGFGLQLRSEELTTHLNLPAPGRRQTLYVDLRLCRVLCF